MKITALIQVRMKSERLPGKALLPVDGTPVIGHVVENLRESRYLDDIVICTTREKDDDALEAFAVDKGVAVYRGDVEDVIKRFHGAALCHGGDVIVRIAGDCPIVSVDAVDLLVENHLAAGVDYTSIEPDATPIGSFPQVFSFQALDRLTRYPLDFNYSEYMLYYFTNNPEVFSLNTVPVPAQYRYPQYRLTLDYEEDLRMFEALFKKLREYRLSFSLKNVLLVLQRHPAIAELNSHLIPKYKNIYDGLMDAIHRATTITSPLPR
ncbi:cytidylyltransferase domain-containing protein [Geobacter sp. DSM 9736]|uniref:cytidylyltransferase domain-containing protein n=1 Tax=Geobacter sp. DSM 9736 TaxID=1277350 RepID=UPI000B50B328|nr:glycosyltransferase family protein [Geobacter sp. DSM 9736]SNB45045.1 spore coat polysaccharide biosynthesis protein SpsF [Geobacter sp. DSM 9736]